MPPQQFFVRLEKGITGGFAPPNRSAVHSLTRSSDAPKVMKVSSAVRDSGTPHLNALGDREILVDDHAALVDELQGILAALPVESPPGSEDIYGLDTSIAFGSDELEWHNGGPQGCGGGNSVKKATPEEKEQFKRAVAIIEHLVSHEEVG